MIIKSYLTAAALGLTLVLGACGSDTNGKGELFNAVRAQASATVKGEGPRRKGKAPYVQITRKQWENTKEPVILINNETRGGSEALRLAQRRNDSTPGQVAVWGGNGTLQLFLRNGVLVGTRGIGADMISSDANATISALRAGRSGNGERRYFMSDGAYSQIELVLSCDIENLGRTTTQVVHLTFPTQHFRESCIGGANDRVRIVNEYWVQPGNGKVHRSRQWFGPLSGYFEIILMKD